MTENRAAASRIGYMDGLRAAAMVGVILIHVCAKAATALAADGQALGVSWQLANLLDDSYTRIANVQGAFEFNQKGTTPNDELFNVFGTAILSMCSKPAQELVDAGEGQANFFVNVSGDIQKTFSVDVSELDDEQGVLMGCSCMTGSPFGQAYVVGVPLASVVEMADLEEGVNTVTAYGADGFGQPLPGAFYRVRLDIKGVQVPRFSDQTAQHLGIPAPPGGGVHTGHAGAQPLPPKGMAQL